jgi:general secretion pathway protein G
MPFCAYCGSATTETSYTLCPSCGNPNNGAPKPQLATGGANAGVMVIVVVVLMVGMVAVVGILAAIAIPNLLTAMQRSKQKRTMADLRSVAVAVETRATNTNDYPKTEDYADLQELLVPAYIKVLPMKDGWGAPFRYECVDSSGSTCRGYALGSGGKDMTFEKPLLGEINGGATSNFDADIIFSNGNFTQYPEPTGVVRQP